MKDSSSREERKFSLAVEDERADLDAALSSSRWAAAAEEIGMRPMAPRRRSNKRKSRKNCCMGLLSGANEEDDVGAPEKLLEVERSMEGTMLTPEARARLCFRLARLNSSEGAGAGLNPPKKLIEVDMGKTV